MRIDKGKKEIALTNNANDLKNAIAKLNASGGAFTQNGIEVASDILNKAPANNKKVMILVSNGEPNIANGIHPDFGEKEKNFLEFTSLQISLKAMNSGMVIYIIGTVRDTIRMSVII